MELQRLRKAAYQGTIHLPPPHDSEILEDREVLQVCLKLTREIADLREMYAANANAACFGRLMTLTEAKEQLTKKGSKLSLKDFFLSQINPDPSNLELNLLEAYVHACLEATGRAASETLSCKTVSDITKHFISERITWRSTNEGLNEKSFLPADLIQVGDRLQNQMIEWEEYSRNKRDLDPLVHLILTVLYFVAVSPLSSNNERIGQILYQYGMMKNGIQIPYPCIQLGKSKKTNAHLGIEERLYGLRTREWAPYLNYSLMTLTKAVKLSMDLLNTVNRLYEQTCQFLNQIGLVSHIPYVSAIFEYPACRTGELSGLTGMRRQVSSHILNDMNRAGILEKIEDGRDRIFINSRLIQLLESEDYTFSPYPMAFEPFIPLYQKGTPGRTKKESSTADQENV